MKMRDKDSAGSRFLDAIVGIELDLVERMMDVYKSYTNISDVPFSTPSLLYEVVIDYPLSSGVIYPENSYGFILSGVPIRTTDDRIRFFTNPPTRLDYNKRITLSGLTSGIAGIEWLNGYPSGHLVVQQDISPVDASSTMYYTILGKDNEVQTTPVSGETLGIGYIGLDQNSAYDIIEPESSGYLRRQYPVGPWTSSSGRLSSMPGDAVIWYESYINEDDAKKYRMVALNNPYGSGIYNLSDVDVSFIPISGTVKVYDILNLTSSGTPTEIDASGQGVYEFSSGTYHYIGYSGQVPGYLCSDPEISGQIATQKFSTSWRLLPESGYVDDEVYPNTATFQWVNGAVPYRKTVRFTNPISKYQIEYQYKLYDSIVCLSSDSKNARGYYAEKDVGDLHFLNGDGEWKRIAVKQAESNQLVYKTSCLNIRPGTTVKAMVTYNSKYRTRWSDANDVDKTIQFRRHNIGYTDNLYGYVS
jgi:hypothetical protein